MVKRKKTLKQKRQSDIRIKTPLSTTPHSASSSLDENPTNSHYQYSFELKGQAKPTTVTKAVHPNEYAVLTHDLRKITIVTGIIVALEIALYYAMSFMR